MGAEVAEIAAARPVREWRARMLSRLGGNEMTRLLLYIGRLSPEKNIGLLVEMMERLAGEESDYRLLVAGSGPLEGWLQAEATRRVPGRIVLLGQIGDRAELIQLYRHADAFIHPNPREPFGIAPLEAMAAGLPLLVPTRGGVLSYANQTNAWLCAPQAEAYVEGVRGMFGNPAVRAERIRQGMGTARQYQWEKIAAAHWRRYEEIRLEFQRNGEWL